MVDPVDADRLEWCDDELQEADELEDEEDEDQQEMMGETLWGNPEDLFPDEED